MTERDNVMLNGERILIVEDEVLIGISLEDVIREAGGDHVVLATTVQEALSVLESVGATLAVLDVDLGSETSLPVAQKLSGDGVPFLYHTAKSPADLSHWPDAPVIRKPDFSNELVPTLGSLASRKISCNAAIGRDGGCADGLFLLRVMSGIQHQIEARRETH